MTKTPKIKLPETSESITSLNSQIADLKAQLAVHTGPGTPSTRFANLMQELWIRFPEVSPYSSEPPEPKFLKIIDSLLENSATQMNKKKV